MKHPESSYNNLMGKESICKQNGCLTNPSFYPKISASAEMTSPYVKLGNCHLSGWLQI